MNDVFIVVVVICIVVMSMLIDQRFEKAGNAIFQPFNTFSFELGSSDSGHRSFGQLGTSDLEKT